IPTPHPPPMLRLLARRRVALGFALVGVVLYFARPTWRSIAVGALVGIVGEAIRLWAAGHLEKGREVTTSGPYRVVRHPLYLGSSIMAVGVMVAGRSLVVAALVAVYIAATIGAAIRTEESFLREQFGDAYDRYAASQAPQVDRRFSLERAWRDREYRAMAGLAAFLGLLVGRMWLS